jgi:hypothetical protein
MSAGAVFQEAMRITIQQRLPEGSCIDVLAALEAGRPGPLDFIYEAGAEVKLRPKEIMARAVAIYFNFCAFNLSDDISDGDCAYLQDPTRVGPCIQVILQILFFDLLAKTGISSRAFCAITQELTAAAAAQRVELRTKKWTAPISIAVGQGISGRQWSAYLRILWFGTSLARQAESIGMSVGVATYVMEDIRSGDCRYTTLSEADKRKIRAWACRAARALHSEHLVCLDALLRGIYLVLKQNPRNLMDRRVNEAASK